ncbi:MAG TPA: Rpn family recombination-promoting nuclease/putative transposase, partial [Chloroflexota bacterium]|nr:Rpn family recombination-promoting nuclease/putative transposase [Chloroflexota bacterium]
MAHGRVNSVGDGRLFRQYNTGTIPDMWQNAGNFKGVTAVDQTGNTGVATTVPQHPIPHHLLARSPHPRYNSPMTVQNPHDRFFRDSFGRPEIARNYLEEYLPANLLALLDLDTLILQEGTFIDESLREQQSDLLYQTRLKGDGRALFLYFLFEHKSQP